MVKVLAVIYNPKPDNEHPHCLFIWEIPEKTLFFPDLIYTHHHHHHSAPSGPTGRDALNNYLISRTSVRHRVRKILPFNSGIPYWSLTWVSDRF